MYAYGPLHMAEQKQGDQLKSTYISSEDRLEAMNNREGWWEGVKDIHAAGMTRW